MPEQLALAYRPRTFDDLVGQPQVQVILRQMVTTDTVPRALLFDGPRGTGKTTTLRILAAALNCDTGPEPCGHCPSCKAVFDGTSLDLMEIDAASHGLVDDIRALRQQVLYSVGGRYRVVGLDEAHSMSTAAFNALLKVLEEPPPGTVFVLLTTEPGRIPDTVYSRSIPFTFRRISTADIAGRLHHIATTEQLQVEPELLTLLANRADGGMRDAIMALDQAVRGGITTAARYAELMGVTDYGPGLLAAIAAGNHAAAYTAIDEVISRTGEPATVVATLVDVLADLFRLHSGGTLTCQADALAARQKLAAQLGVARTLNAARLLWDYQTKLRPGPDTRSALSLLVPLLAAAFGHTPAPEPQPVRKPLSLADLAAMKR